MTFFSKKKQQEKIVPVITDENLEIWKQNEAELQKEFKKDRDPRALVGIFKTEKDYKRRAKWIEKNEFKVFFKMRNKKRKKKE